MSFEHEGQPCLSTEKCRVSVGFSLLFGAGFAGVAFQVAAYLRMPFRIPAHTSFRGVPSANTVPRGVVLITPVAFAILGAIALALFNAAASVAPSSSAAPMIPALLFAESSWLIGAIFWDVASVARGARSRMPVIVTIGVGVTALTPLVAMFRSVHVLP